MRLQLGAVACSDAVDGNHKRATAHYAVRASCKGCGRDAEPQWPFKLQVQVAMGRTVGRWARRATATRWRRLHAESARAVKSPLRSLRLAALVESAASCEGPSVS